MKKEIENVKEIIKKKGESISDHIVMCYPEWYIREVEVVRFIKKHAPNIVPKTVVAYVPVSEGGILFTTAGLYVASSWNDTNFIPYCNMGDENILLKRKDGKINGLVLSENNDIICEICDDSVHYIDLKDLLVDLSYEYIVKVDTAQSIHEMQESFQLMYARLFVKFFQNCGMPVEETYKDHGLQLAEIYEEAIKEVVAEENQEENPLIRWQQQLRVFYKELPYPSEETVAYELKEQIEKYIDERGIDPCSHFASAQMMILERELGIKERELEQWKRRMEEVGGFEKEREKGSDIKKRTGLGKIALGIGSAIVLIGSIGYVCKKSVEV